MHLSTAQQFAADLDAFARALVIHRQHLDAARSAIASNDNAAVRELLGELLTAPRSARRGEGVSEAPVSAPGVGLGEDSPPPLSARRPSS